MPSRREIKAIRKYHSIGAYNLTMKQRGNEKAARSAAQFSADMHSGVNSYDRAFNRPVEGMRTRTARYRLERSWGNTPSMSARLARMGFPERTKTRSKANVAG